jgi:hypothetical protein
MFIDGEETLKATLSTLCKTLQYTCLQKNSPRLFQRKIKEIEIKNQNRMLYAQPDLG